jgi:hypothetical protein
MPPLDVAADPMIGAYERTLIVERIDGDAVRKQPAV